MRKNVRVLVLCLLGGVLAAVGFTGTNAIADSFTDVPESNFFYDEIDWLTDHDIANGFPDGTFDPESNIKRQQAALWFANYNNSIHVVKETVNPGSGTVFGLTIDCASDERALAGGAYQFSSTDELVLTDSYPINANDWSIRFVANDGSTSDPSEISGWALCAPALSITG
jgi:hypothetical protein